MKKRRITFDLPDWMIEALDQYRGLLYVPKTRTDLVAKAVDEYLDKYAPDCKGVALKGVKDE